MKHGRKSITGTQNRKQERQAYVPKFMVCVEVNMGRCSKDKFDSALEHSTAREALGDALGCDVSLKRCEDNYLAQKLLPERNLFMGVIESMIRAVEAAGGIDLSEPPGELGKVYLDACGAIGHRPMKKELGKPGGSSSTF